MDYRFDAFNNGEVLLNKKKNHLPAMGWNSWNAFGSGNTQALTKAMADKIVELGLDKLGYKYLVLDDGCYKSERVGGKLSNEEVKFPAGFKALGDYIHDRGLKFGMYNDIGTNLCAGAAVGTYGFEATDARSYIDWGVDFLKIDNCYYLWDNATFSNPKNARYAFAPNIKSIFINNEEYFAGVDGRITGQGAYVKNGYVTNIGTFDGTNTGTTPVGARSGELEFTVTVPKDGIYKLIVNYAAGEENGCGSWLQVGIGHQPEVGHQPTSQIVFDDLLPLTKDTESFAQSPAMEVQLQAGENLIRIMNHRRQENTLDSYAAMLRGLNAAKPDHDVILSLCEWGKTQPQNWGYKVADSWRILNDITFRVGADGNPGFGEWDNSGTQSVASQYNKAVVMDEFAGLDKGWNDPDMMMVGMNGLNQTMCRSHFSMWCMMNSPLMLGLDLRLLNRGDELYNIIANRDLIALNQDKLGIQAKRVWTSAKLPALGDDGSAARPDNCYITDNNRVDILAKPLADGSLAIAFFNLSQSNIKADLGVTITDIANLLGKKMPGSLSKASSFQIRDLWNGTTFTNDTGRFEISEIAACDCKVWKVSL